MKKIIIDCDVGVDDALALILAFHSPELEVKAVTGVSGNVPLDAVMQNIQKVLSLIRPEKRPFIARGAESPLQGESHYAHSVHGEGGLGNARLALRPGEEWWRTYRGRAHDLIPAIAREYKKEITLIAIGPLTNLALGFQNDPEGMAQLRQLIIMGGALHIPGNITPYAEFNFFVDPLAAQTVLGAGCPITLVPLDITQQVFLTPPILEGRIRPLDNAFSRFVIEALSYDPQERKFIRGSPVAYLHDPLAVAVVIDPLLIRTESVAISVETRAGKTYGRIFEVSGEETSRPPEVEVGLQVDAEKILDLFIHRLSGVWHG